jgi:hypothetical protein
MRLLITLANAEDNKSKIDEIIVNIIKKIDQNKVLNMV